jgi:hypothetical protein
MPRIISLSKVGGKELQPRGCLLDALGVEGWVSAEAILPTHVKMPPMFLHELATTAEPLFVLPESGSWRTRGLPAAPCWLVTPVTAERLPSLASEPAQALGVLLGRLDLGAPAFTIPKYRKILMCQASGLSSHQR